MSISAPGQLEVVAAAGRRGSPHSRSAVSSSAAVGSGGFGSEALSSSSSASSRVDLGLELLDPRARPPASRRSPRDASAPVRFASPIAFDAGVALGLRLLELGPQRVAAARAAPARRPAARRTRRRGAPARPAPAPDRGRSPAGRACGLLRGRAVGRRRRAWRGVASSPSTSRGTRASASASLAGRRCSAASGPDEKPPLRIA